MISRIFFRGLRHPLLSKLVNHPVTCLSASRGVRTPRVVDTASTIPTASFLEEMPDLKTCEEESEMPEPIVNSPHESSENILGHDLKPKYNRSLSMREKRAAKLLELVGFAYIDVLHVLNQLNIDSFENFDPKIMYDAAKFWIENMRPPRDPRVPKREEQTVGFKWREVDLRFVLCYTEPKLLLIDPEEMVKRIKRLKEIGFFTGSTDIWRAFVFAPKAFFLQDWKEFMKKYNYIQHTILEHMVDKKRDPFPTPHPCVKFAKVMEMPYELMKARFEFALRTGMKSASAAAKLEKRSKPKELDSILLFDTNEFLEVYAENCSEEEYLVFQQMILEEADEEDEVLDEIAELESQEYRKCNPREGKTRVTIGATHFWMTEDEAREKDRIITMKTNLSRE